MKHIFFSACIGLLSFSVNSQLNYVDTDWVIDQTQLMNEGEVDTLELDIDQDGMKDMRISSWSNHSNGTQTAVEVLLLEGVGYGGLQIQNGYLADCPSTGFTYQNIDGYIFTSDQTNPYSNQYVKMPFKFQGSAGTHYGLLYVRYQGTTITIEGYVWNQTPNGSCDCNATSWLSLQELSPIQTLSDFEYYNLLGQKVETPEGLVLKVYEDGITEKVFVTN